MDIKHGILIAVIIYLLMQRKKQQQPEEILPPAPPIKDVKQLSTCSNFVDQYGTGRCSQIGRFPTVF